jgi:hypothetical protein
MGNPTLKMRKGRDFTLVFDFNAREVAVAATRDCAVPRNPAQKRNLLI